jgi:rhodanese-related sulfurtransferase
MHLIHGPAHCSELTWFAIFSEVSISEPAIIEISPSEAAAENGSAKLIDVRDQNEWDSAGHLAGAVLVPRPVLAEEIESIVPDRDARVIL